MADQEPPKPPIQLDPKQQVAWEMGWEAGRKSLDKLLTFYNVLLEQARVATYAGLISSEPQLDDRNFNDRLRDTIAAIDEAIKEEA